MALTYYTLLTLSVLKITDATLTLPGIAGLILTLGMAVDANIIIFSRIQEEMRIKKHKDWLPALTIAVHDGFSKAVVAIIDSNVTTLFSAMVLFWLGTGSIKGFALTLSIGVLMSMFSSLVVTKWLIQAVLTMGWVPPSALMKWSRV